MTNQVTLHIEGGRAAFGAAGIELTPWFTRHRLQIPWANVMFVSPRPRSKEKRGRMANLPRRTHYADQVTKHFEVLQL